MLYLLAKTTGEPRYDVRNAFLIRAKTEEEARILANENHMDEGEIWQDRKKVECRIIKEDGPTEIIMIHSSII